MNPTQVSELLTDVLAAHGLELEDVEIAASGKRSRLRIVVDGDGPDGRGPGLDDIGDATRAVSAALDESDVTGTAPYTLEVTSRGVSRPLTLPQHWRRNRGRLVEVQLGDAAPVTGRILRATATTATLEVAGAEQVVELEAVTRAVIQVEFTKSRRSAEVTVEQDETPLDDDVPDDDTPDEDALDEDAVDEDAPAEERPPSNQTRH